MANVAMWAGRVSEWKSSGLTSVAFCKGKPFSAGGLRFWAHRLGKTSRQARVGPRAQVRLGRVVVRPRPLPSPEVPSPELGLKASAPSARVEVTAGGSITVECGGLRVVVPPGFDRPTLAAVVEVLTSRGAR